MPVQPHTDPLPLVLERAGESHSPHAVATSVQGHCDVYKFDVGGREAYRLGIIREVGVIGSVIVPSLWLGFYLVALLQPYMASGN